MKKHCDALFCMLLMICGLLLISSTDICAAGAKKVDDSFLTQQESAIGKVIMQTRGVYLMTGDCNISKSGSKTIYCYASTTANMTVDYVGVIVYVERYNSSTGRWGQVTAWTSSKSNNYYVSTSKTLTVDQGYYYRVRADHIAGPSSGNKDLGNTVSDGIYIP